MPEPLIPLARSVAHEAGRLEREFGYEFRVAVYVDVEAGAVVAEGEGLRARGPRAALEGRLTMCGLRHDTCVASSRIVVYPS